MEGPTSDAVAPASDPVSGNSGKAPAIERPYPRRALEEALEVAKTIRQNNGSNPWPPAEVAKSLGTTKGSSKFFDQARSAREFGLTDAGRDSPLIGLTDLGKRAVQPTSSQEAAQAKRDAFFSIPKFREVVEYYKGSSLPESEYLTNTLETTFGLDPRVHNEFLDVFRKSARFAGIGDTEDLPAPTPATANAAESNAQVAASASSGTTGGKSRPVCFVVMPFGERTDTYATGFFTEVFASLLRPAIEAAGFTARTAQRQGSDVIQSTIIKELIAADLVLADLTEHNPNVLFELGVRMALDKPVALVKARGTSAIFDVDNMLRVESYSPNLWPSTVRSDVPKLTAHVQEAWDTRTSDMSFMKILSQSPGQRVTAS